MTVIVTESLSCMTQEICRTNNVFLVPVGCVIDGKNYSDRITNDVPPPEDSYSVPPSVETYAKAFEKFVSAGHKVICITTTEKLSCAYENAVSAASEYSEDQVRVIDSGVVAGGLFLMVKHVREKFGKDGDLSEIATSLEEYKKRITVKFTSNNTDRLENAHRLAQTNPNSMPSFGQKPVFIIENGSIIHKSAASPGFREISELITELDDPKYVVLHYLEKNEYLHEVGTAIKKKCPKAKIFTVPITLSLKINLGTSIIGIIGD